MEKRLTDYMLRRIAEDVVCDWDVDTAIDEVIWLYRELCKHDRDLYNILIENAESMGIKEEDGETNKHLENVAEDNALLRSAGWGEM